jgi:hypothetical protein
MAITNYGILLKKASTSVGEMTNIELPKISTGSIESTNHASSGLRTYIPDGLIEAETFQATFICTKANYDLVKTDIDAGTVATYSIDFPAASGITDWSFSCFPISIELGTADATSPDLLAMIVEFRPSGDVTGF